MESLVAVFLLNLFFIPTLLGIWLAEMIVLHKYADNFTSSFYKLFFVLGLNVGNVLTPSEVSLVAHFLDDRSRHGDLEGEISRNQ